MVLVVAGSAGGQLMTERYVPIGASPGVSGKYSTIGRISAVNRDEDTLTVDGEDGPRTYQVTATTHIWLDRTTWQLSNLDGSYRDCVVGQRAEVMPRRDSQSVAAWIKIEARDRL